MDTQKHIHHGLALVSFSMTGLFGFSLSNGVTALLFAVSMVLIQAGALLYMPEKFMQAKQKYSGFEMALYGGAVVTALLLSVTASVATLSGSYDQTATAMKERATLQSAIDGYIDAGYITKALTVQEQLEALPEIEITPLASAAVRVEAATGIHGATLVTGFITALAFMLDLFVILLRSNIVTIPVTQLSNGVTINDSVVTQASNAPVTPDIQLNQPVTLSDNVTPEVQAVLSAMNEGLIQKPSVREIRQLLRCSQNQAALIARNCRQLELSI